MNLKEINILELYNKWCFGSGYFEPFVRSGPFVSLKYYEDINLVSPKEIDKGYLSQIEKHIIDENNDTLVIIDLSGTLAIEIGYKLNKKLNFWPVIIFNFLLHPYGIVGDKEFINSLVYYGEAIRNSDENKIALIIDYNRFSDIDTDNMEDIFNNQYEFSEEDLPSSEMLNTLNYKKVLYFCEEKEKEDIKYYLEYLRSNDIKVEIISLK